MTNKTMRFFGKEEKITAFSLGNRIYKIGDWVLLNHRYSNSVVRIDEIYTSGHVGEFLNKDLSNKKTGSACAFDVVSLATDEQIADEMTRRVLRVMKGAVSN